MSVAPERQPVASQLGVSGRQRSAVPQGEQQVLGRTGDVRVDVELSIGIALQHDRRRIMDRTTSRSRTSTQSIASVPVGTDSSVAADDSRGDHLEELGDAVEGDVRIEGRRLADRPLGVPRVDLRLVRLPSGPHCGDPRDGEWVPRGRSRVEAGEHSATSAATPASIQSASASPDCAPAMRAERRPPTRRGVLPCRRRVAPTDGSRPCDAPGRRGSTRGMPQRVRRAGRGVRRR